MFENFKLPRWLGWLAFGIAGIYFLLKIGLAILWLLNSDSTDRFEPAIGLLDIALGILMVLAGAGLRQVGEFTRVARILDKRIRSHVSEEHQQTRSVISNSRSKGYGLQLLKTSNWKYLSGQYRFFCVEDTDWQIVQEEETHRQFHEPWMDNILRIDKSVVVYRTVLKRNDIDVEEIIFLDMDGSRITMPLPRKQGADTFYYCENSFEHLMFNIVKESLGMVMDGVELKNLAHQAKIEWRKC